MKTSLLTTPSTLLRGWALRSSPPRHGCAAPPLLVAGGSLGSWRHPQVSSVHAQGGEWEKPRGQRRQHVSHASPSAEEEDDEDEDDDARRRTAATSTSTSTSTSSSSSSDDGGGGGGGGRAVAASGASAAAALFFSDAEGGADPHVDSVKSYHLTGRGARAATRVTARDTHTIHTDVPKSMGGKDTAPQPVELLLAALMVRTRKELT